jgi:hypothetical protein
MAVREGMVGIRGTSGGGSSRMCRRLAGTLAVVLCCLAFGCAPFRGRYELPPIPELEPEEEPWTKEQKLLALNAGTTAIIAAYGLQFWDYGGANFQTKDEGWFGQNTAYGGADKLGHAYAAYLATLGFSALYEHWGYERHDADLYGAISSMTAFTLIEVGDGFSKNGFSSEDIVVNTAGILFGYARRRIPALGRFVDFRVEYFPSDAVTDGTKDDLVTDYSGYKYLLAFKLEGFKRLENSPLSYLEFHVGYYTRGFLPQDEPFYDEKTRTVYFGIGINLSRVFRKLGLKTVGKFFEFYQVPYTYVPFESDLDG